MDGSLTRSWVVCECTWRSASRRIARRNALKISRFWGASTLRTPPAVRTETSNTYLSVFIFWGGGGAGSSLSRDSPCHAQTNTASLSSLFPSKQVHKHTTTVVCRVRFDAAGLLSKTPRHFVHTIPRHATPRYRLHHLLRQLPLLSEANDRPADELLVVVHFFVAEVPGAALRDFRRLPSGLWVGSVSKFKVHVRAERGARKSAL